MIVKRGYAIKVDKNVAEMDIGTFSAIGIGSRLRWMSERGENMTDGRMQLGVKSVAWKIEMRILQREREG